MFNYNELTKTLIIQPTFNENLVDLPNDVEIIIFDDKYPNYSNFNQNVDKLPPNLTHLTFGYVFNQNVVNLPFTIQKIIIDNKNKIHLFKKIPYGCILVYV